VEEVGRLCDVDVLDVDLLCLLCLSAVRSGCCCGCGCGCVLCSLGGGAETGDAIGSSGVFVSD